jgi:hypothetical protein
MMTATEAIRKLKDRGDLNDAQAEAIVEVIETWHAERAVTRDYLDARLGTFEARVDARFDTFHAQTDGRLGTLEQRLDAKLSDLRARVEAKLRGQLLQIGGLIIVATIIQHYWR